MQHEQEAARSLPQRVLTRLLHLYFRMTRAMTLGVRVVVIREEREVLLLRHTYVDGWHFPGGGVEVGQTMLEAAVRELMEEAAIDAAGPLSLHGIFFNRGMSRRDHVAVFTLRDFTVTAIKRPDREIAEIGFFPLDALPAGTTAATRRRLHEISTGAPPTADW
ncbi:NUDIX domain-containing protein [Bosea sp. (in: a-proteobacteria)]|uniref:NUDIX domain-containing protein n=1 Tax=Bosea sp. (in: a-proteobacteria) TaxID=1871050 RepID=UPI00120B58FA|nr:NUDIX domain-containing protein [Bosea sp. (in: a-proteobacteria)]TAJ28526.1 MAG: NUDIX domain-containing protein [Bosea sp. (in: a-proteobacteria)]